MGFANRVLDYSRDHGFLAPGDKVICALSGGADSVALFWCLYLLRESEGFTLEAAHFNHGLRGAESDRDEAFVRELCGRYDVPLHVGRAEVVPSGKGLEDAARRARYAFFETLDPDAFLATAHTADDNAETVLLHLLRGSGLTGLGGIAPKRGRLIRPMLSVTREDVEAFLEEWAMKHVEDSSNGTEDFLRNRIRHGVMPLLRQENPRFSQNCSRTAESLRQDADYLNREAKAALDGLLSPEGLECAGLLALDPTLRSRVLLAFLRQCGLREPEAVHAAQAERLAEAENPSARVQFPDGVTLERCYGYLRPALRLEGFEPVKLTIPGMTRLPGWEIRCTEVTFPETISRSLFTFYKPCGTIDQENLWVRCRRSGDRMHRPGGHKSLKKLMIDCRIPAGERDSLPLITEGDRILFAAGIGACADCRAEPGAPALRFEFQRKL